MAVKNCGSCGARFEGESAADALATHIEGFHPPSTLTGGTQAAKGKPAAAAGPVVDAGARAAIRELGEAIEGFEDRLTALEAAATAPAEPGDQGGEGKPADEPAAPGAGEAGTPPEE